VLLVRKFQFVLVIISKMISFHNSLFIVNILTLFEKHSCLMKLDFTINKMK